MKNPQYLPADVNAPEDWLDTMVRHLGAMLDTDYLSNHAGHAESRREVALRRSEQLLEATIPEVSGAAVAAELDTPRAYIAAIAKCKRLTSSEEYRLARRMREGEARARDELIESALWLPVMLARRASPHDTALFMDLVAEGNVGLFVAAKTFDPERGYRFSTYAKSAVRQHIGRCWARLRPTHESPSDDAATHAAHPSDSGGDRHLLDGDAADDELGSSQRRDENRSAWWFDPADASDPRGVESQPASEESDPSHQTQLLRRLSVLVQAVNSLSDREQDIVVERFALRGGEPTTLDALAKRLGISLERVRQIEVAALRKLRKALEEAGECADTML